MEVVVAGMLVKSEWVVTVKTLRIASCLCSTVSVFTAVISKQNRPGEGALLAKAHAEHPQDLSTDSQHPQKKLTQQHRSLIMALGRLRLAVSWRNLVTVADSVSSRLNKEIR